MAYAELSDIQARAGALSGSWTDTSKPSLDDVSTFCDDVAAQLDAILGGYGLPTPATGTAAAALKGVNADGALVIALAATFPEGSGPSSASKIIDDAETRFQAAMTQLEDGTHPAIRLLEAGNVQNRASSFWENEPLYGIFPSDPDLLTPWSPDANPSTRPTVTRGTSL